MTVMELLSQIYNEANRKGIDLTKFGIYDDEDLIVRALTLLSGDLEDVFYEDDIMEDEDEEVDEEDAWDFALEDIERIIGRN